MSDEQTDRLIRNTYKVLMTRGMRGTVLYSTDVETREFLAEPGTSAPRPRDRLRAGGSGCLRMTGTSALPPPRP